MLKIFAYYKHLTKQMQHVVFMFATGMQELAVCKPNVERDIIPSGAFKHRKKHVETHKKTSCHHHEYVEHLFALSRRHKQNCECEIFIRYVLLRT